MAHFVVREGFPQETRRTHMAETLVGKSCTPYKGGSEANK
jgi:hypothetical protein